MLMETLPPFVLTPQERAKLLGRLDGDSHHTTELKLYASVAVLSLSSSWPQAAVRSATT